MEIYVVRNRFKDPERVFSTIEEAHGYVLEKIREQEVRMQWIHDNDPQEWIEWHDEDEDYEYDENEVITFSREFKTYYTTPSAYEWYREYEQKYRIYKFEI